jgi:hypothetical protein
VRTAAAGAWLLVWAATAAAQLRYVDIERSMVTIVVPVQGSPPAAGHVIEARLAEGSVDDTDTPHMAIVIDLRDLRVTDPGRSADEREQLLAQLLGPEGLDEARFSRITYHSLTIDRLAGNEWLVRGELEMHGRFLPLTVRATRKGDRFTGTTTLSPADYGVAPMRLGGAAVPVGNEVRVDFDVVLEGP